MISAIGTSSPSMSGSELSQCYLVLSDDSFGSNGKASSESATPSPSSSVSELLPIPSPSLSMVSLGSNGRHRMSRQHHLRHRQHRRCYQCHCCRYLPSGRIQREGIVVIPTPSLSSLYRLDHPRRPRQCRQMGCRDYWRHYRRGWPLGQPSSSASDASLALDRVGNRPQNRAVYYHRPCRCCYHHRHLYPGFHGINGNASSSSKHRHRHQYQHYPRCRLHRSRRSRSY